jgi:hypothetical protein
MSKKFQYRKLHSGSVWSKIYIHYKRTAVYNIRFLRVQKQTEDMVRELYG